MAASRVKKSWMNVKVNLVFYLLSFVFAFISRKVFLDALTADFVGLTGTLSEVISFLYLAEMGIGTSIAYFLYKPLQTDNHQQINEIMSVMGFLYRRIGIFIGIAGAIISLTFPWVFRDTTLPLLFIYFTFASYIGSTLLNFFINYKQIVIIADQRNYVVSAYTQGINYAKSALQIALAYYYKDLYLWVLTEFVGSWVTCAVVNYRVKRAFPWLHIVSGSGRELLRQYPDILKKTKQVFIHNLKNFALRGSDQIFVFAFASLKMVAYYTNYMMLFNKVNVLVNVLSDGMNAGVGNLIAEGNRQNTIKVFWELTAIRFLFVGVVVFGFLFFTQPFISCWLGPEYVLDDWLLYLLVLNMFIMLSRGTVEMFIASSGLFGDVWAAWTELALNLGITLVGGYYYGIWGIVVAKVVSVFFIALFWKPYYLFREGLQRPVGEYWRGMATYYALLALTIAGAWPLRAWIAGSVDSLLQVVGVAIVATALYLAAYFLLLLAFTRGMRDFVGRWHLTSRVGWHRWRNGKS